MAQFIRIAPELKDYVVSNGVPVPSDRTEERAFYALFIPQNNWLYGTFDQGSLLYTLQGSKRTPTLESQVASYSNDAIQRRLINPGYATDVSTVNLASSVLGTSNQVQITPTSRSVSARLSFKAVR